MYVRPVHRSVQVVYLIPLNGTCHSEYTMHDGFQKYGSSRSWIVEHLYLHLHTLGPPVVESLWARKQVSTGALGALDDPLAVQTKI